MGSQMFLTRVIAMTTTIAIVLLVVGFVPNHWLKKTFTISIPASKFELVFPDIVFALVPKSQISSLKNLPPLDIHVTSAMGLYQNCKKQSGSLAGQTLNENICDSEGAKSWQKSAFFLAVFSLLFAAITWIVTSLTVCKTRYRLSVNTSFALVFLSFVTCLFALIPVMFYMMFKRMEINEQLHEMVDFDLDWAIFVMFIGVCLFGLLILLNALNIVLIHNQKEDSDDYKMRNGFEMSGSTLR